MTVAFLLLTTECNRTCPYCFYETGYQGRGDPSRQLRVDSRLFDALRSVGVDKLIISGGEPLIRKDIVELVQKITDQGFFSLMLTNGELMTEPLLDQLVAAGLGAVSLSLDSMARGNEAKAPWEVLARIISKPNLHSAVITPITRRNVHKVGEIVTRVNQLGSYALLQPVFIPEEHPLHAELSLNQCTPEEKLAFRSAIETWVTIYGKSAYAELLLDFYPDGKAAPAFCTMGTHSVVIEPDGRVFPCFHRRDLSAGNLLESDPAVVLKKALAFGPELHPAPCFGEHCISLFSHL